MTDEYETGYAKPPKQSQFKKGQSGNPNGRPKVTLKEGGKIKTVSKTEALVKTIINKALAGNTRFAQLTTALIKELLPLSDLEGQGSQALSEADLAVLNNHADFLKLRKRDRNGD
jgi:hypothetical protein